MPRHTPSLIDAIGDFVGGRLIFRQTGLKQPYYVIATLEEYFEVGDIFVLKFSDASTSKRAITHLRGSVLTPAKDGVVLVTASATVGASNIQFPSAAYCTEAVLHHPRRKASKTPS
jgi:hypothetical protein